MLAVAIGHGLSSSGTQSQASKLASASELAPRTVHGSGGSSATRRKQPGPAPYSVERQSLQAISPGQAILGAPPATRAADKSLTPQPAQGRAQDYRATLTVRLGSVDRMSDAMKKAIRATRAWGGYIVTANYNVPGSNGDAQLVVRIPVQHVQAAIQRFSGLGTLAAQDVSIRDLQSQLDSYTREWLATREKIAKLKVKLTQAETDAQRASLELQIAQAQKAAAELRAEQVALKRQASFANVTLTLTTRKAAAAVTKHEDNRVVQTLKDAASILALELAFALYGLIVIAPIALLAAIIFFAARAGRRRADDRLLGST